MVNSRDIAKWKLRQQKKGRRYTDKQRAAYWKKKYMDLEKFLRDNVI